MINSLPKIDNNEIVTDEFSTFTRAYKYDQLNRLVEQNEVSGYSTSTNSFSGWTLLDEYATAYRYDANGNILNLDRNAFDPLPMDELTYHYYAGTNRLEYVTDIVSDTNYDMDIDDQQAGNYQYDAIGNLVSDAAEGLVQIDWNVMGKVARIEKFGTKDYEFAYDGGGQRYLKREVIGAPHLVLASR